jgi:DNA-binding MarR family transcriptional regulator
MVQSGKSTSAAVVRSASRPPAEADDGEWTLLDEVGFSRQIGFMLRLAQLAMQEYVFSGPDLGLTHSQMVILRLIGARPALTQQRIANALRINKANLTPLIDELVAQGLVVRKNSAAHPRAYALFLTPKGELSAKKAKAIVSRHMSVMDEILDQNERDQFVKTLRKLALDLPKRARMRRP